MSSLTVYAPQVTILNNVVNVIDGLYSLNDVHKASGSDKNHQPTFFMRNKETKALVEELKSEYSSSANMQNKEPVRAVRGVQKDNKPQGTYVCKELVYRYAMWISPKFALVVIRTFDALITRTDAKQRESLVAACDKLAIGNTLRSDVYTMVANHFGYEKVTQIPTPLLPEAVAFVYEMILVRQKPVKVMGEDEVMNNLMWKEIGFAKTEEVCLITQELSSLLARVSLKVLEVNKAHSVIFDSFDGQTHKGLNQSQVSCVRTRTQNFVNKK